MNLILIGYKTSGKTTLANAYSQKFGCQCIDTDALIIQKYHAQKNIGEIQTILGENAFRELEYQQLKSALIQPPTIIATGGGMVLHQKSRDLLKSLGKIIYLNTEKPTLMSRLLALPTLPNFIDPNHPEASIERYLSSRDDAYLTLANHSLDATNKSINQLIKQLYRIGQQHVA